jgi:hypothetical protein
MNIHQFKTIFIIDMLLSLMQYLFIYFLNQQKRCSIDLNVEKKRETFL